MTPQLSFSIRHLCILFVVLLTVPGLRPSVGWAREGQPRSDPSRVAVQIDEGQTRRATGSLSATRLPGFRAGSQVDYTPSTPDERTQFHVDWRSDCVPATGSADCPFPSIAAALDEAAGAGLVGVELDVAPGVYWDPLTITRDTVIRSADPSEFAVLIGGTTRNSTPAYLELEGLTIITAGAGPALSVSNQDAITVLTDVAILAAERFGVAQRGGELWLTNVEISGTRTAPGFPWHGTGLTITGGAIAVLSHVDIEHNESGGILADGEGTYLWGLDIELRGNRVNRFHPPVDSLPSFAGALNVRGGALADLRGLRTANNELISVLVQEGGQAIISDAVIESTSAISPDALGGIGIGAKTGGQLELWDFGIYHNDLLGVGVYSEGTVALHDGEVMYNPVGAWIEAHDPPYDADTLRDNVRWDNEYFDISSERIYVPDPDDALPDF